jgi:hypothetical protein
MQRLVPDGSRQIARFIGLYKMGILVSWHLVS